MRRMTSAVLALAAALCLVLFTASVAGAQTPAETISVTGAAQTWTNANVTVETGETVRWSFTGSTIVHNVHGTGANWNPPLQSPTGTGQDPVDYTFTAPGTYTFLCDIHGPSMGGTVTVQAADELENVLVFTKTQTEPTATFRHSSIDEGVDAIEDLGAANGFNVVNSENGADFNDANLAQYDVVVFLSTTGDILTDTQQAAFERYIQSGGGFAGIHAASDTEYTWPWYGELVGGYFRNHPAGTPQATVEIEDGDEPSTTGLPASWVRTDEWYNFQHPTTPIVGGNTTTADYSPRARHVHVLATIDEGTYGEDDGNTVDDDHPVAWCSEFDGGRSWYTAMGHTEDSFGTAAGNIRQHILGGLRTAAGAGDCGERRDMPPTAAEFEKVTLNNDTNAPMEIDVAADGRAFYIELDGRVQMWSPTNQQTTTVGTIPVELVHENGLLGIQLAPDFATTGHIYLAYSVPTPTGEQFGLNNVSRFTLTGNTLGQQQVIFQWRHQRQECCHTGGSLDFGPDGNLYISTGDNTNPFAHGFNPTDERAGRQFWDAQRTSANSNDPNGKILRIRPIPGATGVPGIGTTYTIPAGNMFDEAQDTQNRTLPEIYAMGFRNPFRIHVDQGTGWVLVGDYGPDAPSGNAGRGPQGSVEFNVVKQPGFYGWPYCIRQNTPYHDITYTNDGGAGTDNGEYNCAAPVNNSPNNTGLTNLPAAIPATMWMGYSDLDQRFTPDLGGGGAPMTGPRYYFDEESDSETKFPRFYDGKWFIGEWNVDWVKTADLNDQGLSTGVACFAICSGYISPMDLEFGPNGSLYVVEWGQGFNENNPDSGVYRIDYVRGQRAPRANATASADAVPVGATVNFSSAGSNDPDGTAITYLWDFKDGSTSTEANPSHTFTERGTYDVTLTVTDEAGDTGVDTVRVVVGNERPVVTILLPEDGKVADLGETVPYEITVDDPDGGSTEEGTIDCEDVRVELKLGHDTHAHELQTLTGCEGEFSANGIAGHGLEANIFTVVTANYTDEGNGPAVGVTGSDEAIVQPRLKQAEFWSTTGRTADARGGGDPGVVNEATQDVGGSSAAAFIEDGDWISFTPYNLEDLDKATFRVASGGAGGTIELRYDAANGPLVTSAAVTPTGSWQTWADVTINMPETVPEGTHRLFLVFRHPTDTGGLMNLNWFKFIGKGAAVTAPPEVTATATPATGTAPLNVQFDAEATDAEGEELTYEWDFGVAGTTADVSDEEDPTYTYAAPGTYTATVTVTDESGGEGTASTTVRVTRGQGQCPPTQLRSDEFEGNALDLNRWQIIRQDGTRPPSVSGGSLNYPIDNGSIYGPGTSARNIIVQPLPNGEVEVTAKITVDALTENYQQAGLRVYADDNNWASVHMIYAGTGRDFEFIYEDNGNPRNEAADKLGGIPATAPLTYYVKLISDGSTLRAEYSYDGEDFLPVGRPADIADWVDPKVGPAALSDQAATYPVAHFDWVRFDPDESAGGGGGSETELFADQFDGDELGAGWTVVRGSQALDVSSGALRYPAATGDLYQDNNTASNLVLRAAPASGPWTATAKINFEGVTQYQQAGIIAYGDDNNYVKLGRIAHSTAGDEKFEFIHEANQVADNLAADSTPNIATAFPDDYWVQLRYDGTNLTGWYSQNGTDYLQVGRAWALPANARLGLFAFGNTSTSAAPEAAFDSIRITAPGGAPSGPSRDDDFDGSTLDKTRWNAIVRDTPAEYEVAGGELTVTTSQGDIYTGDTNPPPNNFILQDAAHAGADWTIETRIPRASIIGEYAQGGLIAYANGDNYVKFDVISDDNNTRINRIELRSEVGGLIQEPDENVEIPVANDDGPFYLRLTKAGTNYTGEYSYDGQTWTPFPGGPVPNAMASPDFGLFAFSPQPEAVGDTVTFDYFLLDGRDAGEPCDCEPGRGDEFDDATLDKTRWNNIVREQEDLYALEDGWLEMTTVNGDIYTNGNPATTRNFILQDPDPGQDWVIETHIDASTISDGYEQAGLLVYQDDDNYIKFDILSDPNAGTPTPPRNRIELRSEINGAIQTPQPADPAANNATEVWLRLTKTGTSYAGEYSFNGTTWSSVNIPVTNPMVDPAFGIFTLGVNSGGARPRFEYFSVDGNRGECEEPEPENRAPVIEDAAANPQSGFAPLQVAFSVTANDPDEGDTLTYAWDFDGNGTTDSTQEDPTHTYTTAGDYQAEVTVSDGEAERSRTVPVSVFGPDDPEARFRVLVFSRTAGFRHDSIDEAHAAIEELGEEHDFQVDHTEDPAMFTASSLAHYDAVIWANTTGDVLNAAQQTAFEAYIRGGGGYVGLHSAADTEYEWPFYGQLVGAYFRNHPPGTPAADVHVTDPDDHSTQGLPATYNKVDEWYNYQSPVNPTVGGGGADYNPRNTGVHVLMTVDESDYVEEDGSDGVDDEHPISWCRRIDGGRTWYTGMGHTAASYTEANYLSHILGGIETAAGEDVDSPECGAQDPDAPRVQAFGDPTSGSAPLEVQFSSTAIDPNGTRLPDTAFKWEFGDGSGRFGRTPVHTYETPGVYTATLTVRDPEGKTGTDTVQITVNPRGNLLPMVDAVADPASGNPPLTVDFEAVGIDPDGDEDRITYEWEFGDGNGGQFGRQVSHTYRTAGTYTAKVTATDQDGGSASKTLTVVIKDPPGNQPPTVRALADPRTGPAPLKVRLSAAPGDLEDGNNLLVTWNFGDGKSGAGEQIDHTYTTAGTYTATVTVEDTDGEKATASVQIVVSGSQGGGQGLVPDQGGVAGETETNALVRVTKRHNVARVIKRGLRYTVACDATCRVSATLRIAGGDRQRLGRTAVRRIGAGDSRRLVLKLDRNVRSNLVTAMRKAKLRNLRATLVLKIRTAEGTTTVRKAVVLRR